MKIISMRAYLDTLSSLNAIFEVLFLRTHERTGSKGLNY